MALPPLRDAQVWGAVRLLYLGSGLLFLATVALGIANAFMADISRAQVLAHFHSGSIGWVTLSVVATTVWLFTGQQTVTSAYRGGIWLLAGIGIVTVAGYIAAFAFAFNGGPAWMLPVFGVPTALAILATLAFAIWQLRRQTVVTTPHLLLLGALLVASLGAVMGVLIGLSHAGIMHAFPAGEGVSIVGAHAGPMDMYLALAFGAIVELLVLKDHGRWTRPGMAQMVLGVTSGFLTSFALFTGIVGPIAPVALLLFLVAFGFYMVRVGWRAVATRPASGRDAALFFGGLFFPVYILFFVTAVMVYFIPDKPMPHFLEIAFVHVIFIGMATNLLIAMRSAFPLWSGALGSGAPAGLAAGVWTLNIGLLLFFAGEFIADRKEGALVMAAGVLISMYAVDSTIWRARLA